MPDHPDKQRTGSDIISDLAETMHHLLLDHKQTETSQRHCYLIAQSLLLQGRIAEVALEILEQMERLENNPVPESDREIEPLACDDSDLLEHNPEPDDEKPYLEYTGRDTISDLAELLYGTLLPCDQNDNSQRLCYLIALALLLRPASRETAIELIDEMVATKDHYLEQQLDADLELLDDPDRFQNEISKLADGNSDLI